MDRLAVVIPNWNGKDMIISCLDSLLRQSLVPTIIVVDNGSNDGSVDLIKDHYPNVILLIQSRNLGFAEGVNIGIRHAIDQNFSFVALLNNDAAADRSWCRELYNFIDKDKTLGAVMSTILSSDKKTLDGSGEVYTSWGIHYPRGRGQVFNNQYRSDVPIFGASGGASVYRVAALNTSGLFDKDFFAYYEDIDLSWRLQLSGWRVGYAQKAIVYHAINGTSGRIKGFTTYQSLKNLPWVVWKNVPIRLLWRILPRFLVAYTAFFFSAIFRGHGTAALKGVVISLLLLPKKIFQRFGIQASRKVSNKYLTSIIQWDLPPDQVKLRKLRKLFTGK